MSEQFARNIAMVLTDAHPYLLPTTAEQDVVDLEDALSCAYIQKPLEECSFVFLRRLHEFQAHLPSERGRRIAAHCLTTAIKNRFHKGHGFGMPGLVMADILEAEQLKQDITSCSGAVEPQYSDYTIPTVPETGTWEKTARMLAKEFPKHSKHVHTNVPEEEKECAECGLEEQDWWEAWVNELEKTWGMWAHEIVPVHLREPIKPRGDDADILLAYDAVSARYSGENFNTNTREASDYRGPMDWDLRFTFHLWILSILAPGISAAREWLTETVLQRVSRSRGVVRKPWLTTNDVKKAVDNLATHLDSMGDDDEEMEDAGQPAAESI